MKHTERIFLISLLLLWLLTGCSTLTNTPVSNNRFKSAAALNNTPQESILHDLYRQYAEWNGVRYKFGGLSKNGIDCSGFVYLTYKTRLGVSLPRTARLQSQYGKTINKHELKAGDLVFFRTGRTSKHVGIYLENNTFLHVSQKKGVIISHLDNVYWKAKYWKSIRV